MSHSTGSGVGVLAKKPVGHDPWDVAIIGSGPAAFTAAIYTTRGAASTVILGGESWGGQLMITTTVDNFPAHPGIQGPDLMAKMRQHATLFGGEFIAKKVDSVNFDDDKVFELFADGKKYSAKSVIVATGADTKWLGIPGEKELVGKGISSCAPCDAPFFKDKKVIVVGGGDSAMEEAMVLVKVASEVTIVHRRDVFKASQAMQKKIFESQKQGKIKIIWNSEIVRFMGKDKLEKVAIKDKDDKITEVVVDGVFVAIGHIPATEIFQGHLELDEMGYVKKVPKDGFQMATSKSGVFVAGDVHDYHFRQAITASGFGCMAGLEALKFLDKPIPVW